MKTSNNIDSNNTKLQVAVIGIGRVGLPLALVLAKEGFEVIGVDLDKERLNSLQQQKVPFKEDGAQELLEKVYGEGFSVIHEEALSYVLPKMDVIILTLGTTIDSSLSPSVSQITEFFEKFTHFFRKGQTIVLRSTLTPGTTEYVARFINEKIGLEVGKDIYLACCPERIAEGNAILELYEIPQIIGTLDQPSAQMAARIFSHLTDKILYTDPRSAELAKLYCNMYRYIDFAIGNEFMLIAESHERSIYQILELVNHGYKRGGVKGPGFTAGACLVKDGFFLIDKSPFLDLIAAAWRVNESIPGFLINKLKTIYHSLANKKIAILGLGFKRNIDDTRYSLSLKLKQYLTNEGAEVLVHDPYLPSVSLEEAIKDAQVIIIAVNNDEFKDITLERIEEITQQKPIICDIWNMLGTGNIVFALEDALVMKRMDKELKKESSISNIKKGNRVIAI